MSVGLAAFDAADEEDDDVLIVPGDAPLLRTEILASIVRAHVGGGHALTVLTTALADPTGYGRVIHGRDGAVARIVEELDASDEERAETEVNTSIFMVKRALLGPALRRLDRTNSQSEYYLTDVVSVLYNAGHVTRSVLTEDHAAVAGVNDRVQLSVGRGRAAAPHQRALDAARGDDVGPRVDLRRRRRRARRGRLAAARARS